MYSKKTMPPHTLSTSNSADNSRSNSPDSFTFLALSASSSSFSHLEQASQKTCVEKQYEQNAQNQSHDLSSFISSDDRFEDMSTTPAFLVHPLDLHTRLQGVINHRSKSFSCLKDMELDYSEDEDDEGEEVREDYSSAKTDEKVDTLYTSCPSSSTLENLNSSSISVSENKPKMDDHDWQIFQKFAKDVNNNSNSRSANNKKSKMDDHDWLIFQKFAQGINNTTTTKAACANIVDLKVSSCKRNNGTDRYDRDNDGAEDHLSTTTLETDVMTDEHPSSEENSPVRKYDTNERGNNGHDQVPTLVSTAKYVDGPENYYCHGSPDKLNGIKQSSDHPSLCTMGVSKTCIRHEVTEVSVVSNSNDMLIEHKELLSPLPSPLPNPVSPMSSAVSPRTMSSSCSESTLPYHRKTRSVMKSGSEGAIISYCSSDGLSSPVLSRDGIRKKIDMEESEDNEYHASPSTGVNVLEVNGHKMAAIHDNEDRTSPEKRTSDFQESPMRVPELTPAHPKGSANSRRTVEPPQMKRVINSRPFSSLPTTAAVPGHNKIKKNHARHKSAQIPNSLLLPSEPTGMRRRTMSMIPAVGFLRERTDHSLIKPIPAYKSPVSSDHKPLNESVNSRTDEEEEWHQRGLRCEAACDYTMALHSYGQSLNSLKSSSGKSERGITQSWSVQERIAKTLQRIGIVHWKQGAYEDSINMLSTSLGVYESLSGGYNNYGNHVYTSIRLELVDCLLALGRTHHSIGNTSKAFEEFKRAFAILKSNGIEWTTKQVSRTLFCLGSIHHARGRYSRALANYEESLQILSKIGNEAKVDAGNCLHAIGQVYEEVGQTHKASQAYSEALWIYRVTAKENGDYVEVAVALGSLGNVMRITGGYTTALANLGEALDITVRCLGDRHRNVATLNHSIALVYIEQGSHTKAMDILRDVLDLQKECLGCSTGNSTDTNAHPDVATTLWSIGCIYEKRGKLDKSLRLFVKSLRLRRAVFGKTHVLIGLTLDKIGSCHVKNGDTKEALARYTDALKIYRANKIGEDHHRVKDLVKNIKNAMLTRRTDAPVGMKKRRGSSNSSWSAIDQQYLHHQPHQSNLIETF
mmetsp:Transcript_41467/g.49743  ORF Transcript_41467/g.49743 Transcript_41467/m.49743 type:complete len:1086 (+) Transcript_41467:34-3291(+)